MVLSTLLTFNTDDRKGWRLERSERSSSLPAFICRVFLFLWRDCTTKKGGMADFDGAGGATAPWLTGAVYNIFFFFLGGGEYFFFFLVRFECTSVHVCIWPCKGVPLQQTADRYAQPARREDSLQDSRPQLIGFCCLLLLFSLFNASCKKKKELLVPVVLNPR